MFSNKVFWTNDFEKILSGDMLLGRLAYEEKDFRETLLGEGLVN
jgi:hypothetical protein